MAAEQRMTTEEERLKTKDFFRRNAFMIIEFMVELSPDHPSELVDEILHSIFFLGEINNPPYSPEYIVTDDKMLKALRDCYPRPFELYSSQLPKRSPISCVLDMIVRQMGQNNEDKIKKKLKEIINKLKEDKATNLVSSTICVSQIPNSVRYYGVSMSTSGRNTGQIMVAASCLSAWDSYVAGAVMTYYPEKVKKPYFDGTIQLPKQVRCEAFSLSDDEKKKDPCRSCGNLFGLTAHEAESWPHGHCAEAESVSNLLKNEEGVRKKVQLTSTTCTDENRKKAKDSVLTELKRLLQLVKFDWKNEFYTPQSFILKRGNN